MSSFVISFSSFVIGVGLLVFGASQVYPPAGLMLLGVILIGFSVLPRMHRP